MPDVSERDRDIRGVYLCICYGPGFTAFYVGSSGNVYVRIIKHDQTIAAGDTSITLYRALAGIGTWTYRWKMLARFADGTHPSFSYLLETLCIMVFKSMDNSRTGRFHNVASQELYKSAMKSEEITSGDFDFTLQPINHQSPLLAGWSMKTNEDKVCQCGESSKEQKTWSQ